MILANTPKSTQERVKYFRIVRDIPYYIGLNEKEQDYCCLTKPLILDRLLRTLDVETRHILCQFKWSQLPLPKDILAIPHDDEDTHEYLEVRLPETGTWVRVDPNWDKPLKSLGLSVAEWDGHHDTQLAVSPLTVYSAEESARMIAAEDETDPKIRLDYIERNFTYFRAINQLLQSQRVKSA